MPTARTELHAAGRVGIVRRVGLYLVLFLAALTCIGAQLDHAVEKQPSLARLVFPPFAGLSHAVAAEKALATEMKNASVREAKALALARPTASESFSRLARAYALNGEAELAQKAILASATRGWRDPLAQLVILQAAMNVEDWDVVAQRLTALRKMRREHDFFDQQLVQLASVERGRTELAAQLAVDPMGQRQFMRDGLSLLPADYFADIMVKSASTEQGMNCDTFNLATERLLRTGDRRNALKVWLDDCRGSANAGFADIAFGRGATDELPGPFEWRYPRGAGLSNFTASDGEGQTVLRFANNSRLNKVVAERVLLLDPGSARVNVRLDQSRRAETGRKPRVSPVIQCFGARKSVLTSSEDGDDWTVQIPGSGCDVQLLQILATPGRSTVASVSVSQ